MSKRILILGGYGHLGTLIARYLIKRRKDLQLILAGRKQDRALSAANNLIKETGFKDIEGICADASSLPSMILAMKDVDLVIVASSTIKYADKVIEACLKTNTDYLDTQLSSPLKLAALREKQQLIRDSERIFITDAGFHPGLPAAIIRWADLKVGPIYKASIFTALKVNWNSLHASPETLEEMVEEFKYFDPSILRDGKWKKMGYNRPVAFDFGEPFRNQDCIPMCIDELKRLPEEYPDLKNMGFYVSGFNKILDYFLFPFIMIFLYILPEKLKSIPGSLFRWGLGFSKPPYGVRLIAECEGENGKLTIKFSDSDGYTLTAIPIVACLDQYLDGTIERPGLYRQSWAVEPNRFFTDMREMGLDMITE